MPRDLNYRLVSSRRVNCTAAVELNLKGPATVSNTWVQQFLQSLSNEISVQKEKQPFRQKVQTIDMSLCFLAAISTLLLLQLLGMYQAHQTEPRD